MTESFVGSEDTVQTPSSMRSMEVEQDSGSPAPQPPHSREDTEKTNDSDVAIPNVDAPAPPASAIVDAYSVTNSSEIGHSSQPPPEPPSLASAESTDLTSNASNVTSTEESPTVDTTVCKSSEVNVNITDGAEEVGESAGSEVHRAAVNGEILLVEDLGLRDEETTSEQQQPVLSSTPPNEPESHSRPMERAQSARSRPKTAVSGAAKLRSRPASARPTGAVPKQSYFSSGPGGKLHKFNSREAMEAWEAWKESSDRKLAEAAEKRAAAKRDADAKKARETESKKQAQEAYEAWKRNKDSELSAARKVRRETEEMHQKEIDELLSQKRGKGSSFSDWLSTKTRKPSAGETAEIRQAMTTFREQSKSRQVKSEAAIDSWKQRKREQEKREKEKRQELARKHAAEARRINANMERVMLNPSR